MATRSVSKKKPGTASRTGKTASTKAARKLEHGPISSPDTTSTQTDLVVVPPPENFEIRVSPSQNATVVRVQVPSEDGAKAGGGKETATKQTAPGPGVSVTVSWTQGNHHTVIAK